MKKIILLLLTVFSFGYCAEYQMKFYDIKRMATNLYDKFGIPASKVKEITERVVNPIFYNYGESTLVRIALCIYWVRHKYIAIDECNNSDLGILDGYINIYRNNDKADVLLVLVEMGDFYIREMNKRHSNQ